MKLLCSLFLLISPLTYGYSQNNNAAQDVWFGPGYYYGVWFDDEDDYWGWRGDHADYPPNRDYYNHDHPVNYDRGVDDRAGARDRGAGRR